MPEQYPLIMLILAAGAFTQGLTGFGDLLSIRAATAQTPLDHRMKA